MPDPRARLMACEAAKQKVITRQVERVNADLKEQLLKQQLYYASLQRSILEAPLGQMASISKDMLDRIHGYLHLNSQTNERIEQLQNRIEISFRLAPSIVDAFTKDIAATVSPTVPFSRTNAMGTDKHTLVSNIFVCKIPNTPLPRIYEAITGSYKIMHSELRKRLGVQIEHKVSVAMHPSFSCLLDIQLILSHATRSNPPPLSLVLT